ncbi:DUF2164 domain-containing protein [Thalassomonas sp. M1454]|uniref:DUF2164 domain-containing protein n=1 Tax=Thalassomonas sp. M1454 TaxID=2594477 RepID=UPI0021B0EBA2|nr:DUF2164 domain-containing protein [Thalassomonas sp. M1454]
MIKFTRSQNDAMVAKIQRYFINELDQDIGQFDAEFLIDFFAKEMGNAFYNKGLLDAQAIVNEKVLTISDAIYEIEQPSDI